MGKRSKSAMATTPLLGKPTFRLSRRLSHAGIARNRKRPLLARRNRRWRRRYLRRLAGWLETIHLTPSFFI